MGGGTGIPFKTYNAVEKLRRHPNYKEVKPLKDEPKIRFILRSVAELISPPQDDIETYELECIEVSKAVMMMEDDLEKIWNDHRMIK